MNTLERLAALAEKASARPWRDEGGMYGAVVTDGPSLAHMDDDSRAAYNGNLVGESVLAGDRALIVVAVNALPDLLAVARKLSAFTACERPQCSGCSHEYHGIGACWGGRRFGSCPCRNDREAPCGACGPCLAREALAPLLREVGSDA